MMGKTHIAFGVATALLVMQPRDVAGCAVAVVGGSVGGILCDIEVRSNRRMRDALHARYIVAGIVLVCVLVDLVAWGPIASGVSERGPVQIAAAAVVFTATAVYSRARSKHRGFSHSMLALALFTLGVGLLVPYLAVAFALGFASHIALDLLNKKPIQLLFPSTKANICLRWCYANGITNKVLMWVGFAGVGVGLCVPFL